MAPGFGPQPPQIQAPQSLPPADVPVLPPGVRYGFLPARGGAGRLVYQPMILGNARVDFRDTKSRTDVTKNYVLAAPISDEAIGINWDAAMELDAGLSELESSPTPGVPFANLPSSAGIAKNYTAWARDFADWLYRTQQVELMVSPTLKVYSGPGESERDFRVRLDQDFREKRDEAIDALRKKYAAKIDSAIAKVQRAEDAVDREMMQAKQQQMQTAISMGATLLTSLLGSKKLSTSTLGRATTAARGASRYSKEQSDVKRSQETAERYREQLQALEEELQEETAKLTEKLSPLNENFDRHTIRPYKKDVLVDTVMLVWVPVQAR